MAYEVSWTLIFVPCELISWSHFSSTWSSYGQSSFSFLPLHQERKILLVCRLLHPRNISPSYCEPFGLVRVLFYFIHHMTVLWSSEVDWVEILGFMYCQTMADGWSGELPSVSGEFGWYSSAKVYGYYVLIEDNVAVYSQLPHIFIQW